MKEERISNYEVMKKQMEDKFISFEQEKMISKFSLRADGAYIYIRFVEREYRINRKNGLTEWSEDEFQNCVEADYNEAMTIFDVLCESKDNCRIAGKFCPTNGLTGMVYSAQSGSGFFQRSADYFVGKLDLLEKACGKIGQKVDMKGDLAFQIMAFDFLPVIFQFWDADEEFSASLQFLVDENIQDFMHFETVMFMLGHIVGRIRENLVFYQESESHRQADQRL